MVLDCVVGSCTKDTCRFDLVISDLGKGAVVLESGKTTMIQEDSLLTLCGHVIDSIFV